MDNVSDYTILHKCYFLAKKNKMKHGDDSTLWGSFRQNESSRTLYLSKFYETEVKNNSNIINQYVWANSTHHVSNYIILTFFI
jgi:hypothetical protein